MTKQDLHQKLKFNLDSGNKLQAVRILTTVLECGLHRAKIDLIDNFDDNLYNLLTKKEKTKLKQFKYKKL